MIVHSHIRRLDGTIVEPFEFEYPEWPRLDPFGVVGPIDPATIHAGAVIQWIWRWMDCNGGLVASDSEPRGVICRQPGVCVVHDPPGTVVPF